jgi:hypothetical protein
MTMIDGEISLKSLLFITESLEQLIGPNGSKAVLRTAGQRAAGNLIGILPLTLSEEDVAHRTRLILAELGFIDGLQMPATDTLQITGNHFFEELDVLRLQGTRSARYYIFGLLEGFFKQMSGSERKVVSVEPAETCEYWKSG